MKERVDKVKSYEFYTGYAEFILLVGEPCVPTSKINEDDSLKLGREIWVGVNHSAEFLKLYHRL